MNNQPADSTNPIPPRRRSPIQSSQPYDPGPAQEFGAAALSRGKGFLSALFDFSFNYFITVKIAKVLFGVFLILAAIQTVLITAASFQISTTLGVFFLVFLMIPLFLLLAIIARLSVEMIVVVFRIGENAAEIAMTLREASPDSNREQSGRDE